MPRYGEPNDPTPHCPPELVERANRRLAARAPGRKTMPAGPRNESCHTKRPFDYARATRERHRGHGCELDKTLPTQGRSALELEKALAAALASPVWRYMQERYTNAGWVLFAESSFAENTVGGDLAAGRRALEVLEQAGLVMATVRLVCPEGHTLWEGPPEMANSNVPLRAAEGCYTCQRPRYETNEPIDVEDIGRELYWHLVIGPDATPKRLEPPTAEELAKALLELLNSPNARRKDTERLLARCPWSWLR